MQDDRFPIFQDPRDLPAIVAERTYVPELDYKARNYESFGTRIKSVDQSQPDTMIGPEGHFCDRCKSYYKNLTNQGVLKASDFPETGWPIVCYGDKSKQADAYTDDVLQKLADDGIIENSDEAKAAFKRNWDPVAWAEWELGVRAEWYQAEMIRCTSIYKTTRAGRRVGKTYAACIDILYKAFTKEGRGEGVYEILVVAPYESQVKRIFEELDRLIQRSPSMRASLKRQANSPGHEREFHNGVMIRGFSAGSKSGARSAKIRGQGAAVIYFDEIDFMADEDIETIISSMASEKDTKIWMMSTPTGARSKLWTVCVKKNLQYKEFHYISQESPRWGDRASNQLKAMFSEGGFRREFLAEFGTPTEGVFRQIDIDNCLRDYSYQGCQRNPAWKYVVGVDWNKLTGTHIVVLERGVTKNGIFYRVVDKQIMRKVEFQQHEGVRAVVRMALKWNADFVYVDQGFGEMQVEGLWREDLAKPELGLEFAKKLKPIYMNQTIKFRNPLNPAENIEKPAKPFMVDMLANWVSSANVFLPSSEDTRAAIIEEDITLLDVGIVQQMREFHVEKYTRGTNAPIYSQGYEHTMTAMMLAVLGMVENFSEINEFKIDTSVRTHNTPFGARLPEDGNTGSGTDIERDVKETNRSEELHQLHQATLPSRTVDASAVGLPSGGRLDIENFGKGVGLPTKKTGGFHGPRTSGPSRTIP